MTRDTRWVLWRILAAVVLAGALIILFVYSIRAAAAQDAGVGQWPQPDGGTGPVPCPAVEEYGRVTALPQGCEAERPCACYTLEEHTATVGEVAGIRAQNRQLVQGLNAQEVAFARQEARIGEFADLAEVAATAAAPPPYDFWHDVGLVAGGGAVGLLVGGLACFFSPLC